MLGETKVKAKNDLRRGKKSLGHLEDLVFNIIALLELYQHQKAFGCQWINFAVYS